MERQQRAARVEKLEEDLRVQHIYAEFIDSQHTLRQQMHVSRAREEKLHADLLAAEQERERLKSLVSTLEASDKKWREREEIVATAKARCVEVEANASKLRADLVTAKDRARSLQEQLDSQTRLASSKDYIIQSITEESRLKLEVTEDEIARLRRELGHEHDRRLRETKELLDERARTQDRHEAEMHLIAQEARDAQDQLATLRDVLSRRRADGRFPLVRAHSSGRRHPTTELVDNGLPPLPPEQILDAGNPPVSLTIDPDPLRYPTKSSRQSSGQDGGDLSTCPASRLLQYPAFQFFDQTSDVAKAQRAALEELLERMRQPESESAQDVKPDEQDDRHLEEELTATTEQLRLTEEEVLILRRDLGRSRATIREVKSRARDLEHKLGMCQARLRKTQDARRDARIRFAQALELLSLRRADFEWSIAEAKASQFKCSQVTFLSAALQERVTELEAEVKTLKTNPTGPGRSMP
jgi:chromosome segregation ATPase